MTEQPPITDIELGLVVGLLIGEGHFGGDGKYPQITLRMHTRHESLFRWLEARFPRARLYGPYEHGGRSYFQWIARGPALAEDVLPLVERVLDDELDAHVAGRVRDMRTRYGDFFARYERGQMSDRALDRIAELRQLHGIVHQGALQLATVLEVLARDDRAPTSVRQRERAVDVHIADSLSALALEPVQAAERIVDIGSGSGFPGLPIAIAKPAAQVFLLESVGRKCAFLDAAIEAIGITNASVVSERAESWIAGIGAHDLAMARALAPPPAVLEYAAPLLRVGGALVDWRGRRDREDRSGVAAAELGLELVESRRVTPFTGAQNHTLNVYLKVGETPGRYPRRPGVARKRPLGAPKSIERIGRQGPEGKGSSHALG